MRPSAPTSHGRQSYTCRGGSARHAAADPALGVVDRSARVHGMEKLYVAGASSLPTAGFANPTLTIVALALRLARYLLDEG
ncbi:MAG TPA: GMC oxidoreductase [Gemmatimonadaceae bacterium]|nr:GMC oxidoreductase [Gemmatimonadaceae bacterium]